MIDVAAALTTTAECRRHRGVLPVQAAPMHIVAVASPAGTFTRMHSRISSTTIAIARRLTLTPLSVGALAAVWRPPDVDSSGVARRTSCVDGLDVVSCCRAAALPGNLRSAKWQRVAAVLPRRPHDDSHRPGAIHASVTDGSIPGLETSGRSCLARSRWVRRRGSGRHFPARGRLRDGGRQPDVREPDDERATAPDPITGGLRERDAVPSRELTGASGTDLRRFSRQDGRVGSRDDLNTAASGVSRRIFAASSGALGNELRRATSLLEGLFKKKKDQ